MAEATITRMTEKFGTSLFHVAIADDWEAALGLGFYEASTRGRALADEGFIHVATSDQLPMALSKYSDLTLPLLLIVLDPSALDEGGVPVEWEGDENRGQPRLLGPIPTDDHDAVRAVLPLTRQAGQWLAPDPNVNQ